MVDEVMTVARLKEGLEGVYDLDSAKDCKDVIRMLVRDLNLARAKEKEAEERTRTLAVAVTGGNVKEAEALARKVVEARRPRRPDVLTFLMSMGKEMEAAEKLTDARLAEEILDKVWGAFDMSGKESALLGEAARRLKDGREVAT